MRLRHLERVRLLLLLGEQVAFLVIDACEALAGHGQVALDSLQPSRCFAALATQ